MTSTSLSMCVAMMIGAAGAACSPSPLVAAKADDHFTCAAMISAADRLRTAGQLPPSSATQKELVAVMTHINAWAVPKQLPERQAFDEVNSERDRLMATLSSSEIATRAQKCVDQV